ncbi:hypothetical protein Pfo_018337 [Paulownia fortunei]|nr:hypothetical protein Pfo_018337 [Paulownia fortunei]
MFVSLSEPFMVYIASSTSSLDAWDRLALLYANHSRSCVLFLKDKLSLTTRGDKSVTEFLQTLKRLVNQLALVGTPLDEDDLILHCLNGIRCEFKEISGVVAAREQPIFFEDLHDKLVEYKDYLKSESKYEMTFPVTANYSHKNGSDKNKFSVSTRQSQRNYTGQNRSSHSNQPLEKTTIAKLIIPKSNVNFVISIWPYSQALLSSYKLILL